MVSGFANGPGDLDSIPGRAIPKTQDMVFDTTLLNIQHYKIRVKWSNPWKEVAPSPISWCRSYRKGSFRVTLNYVVNFTQIIGISFAFSRSYKMLYLHRRHIHTRRNSSETSRQIHLPRKQRLINRKFQLLKLVGYSY